MFDWVQVLVLSCVQGLTEFLPVSSSAHLILVPKLLGWNDQGLTFDVAVHLGTLLAVLAYFREDLRKMIPDFFQSLSGKKVTLTSNAKLLWAIGFATIPAGLAGLLLKETVGTTFRSTQVIAYATIFFGVFLWLADWLGKRARSEADVNRWDVFWIGCGQALALIPGTSRSGITLTAALARGLTREAAARFSFLLSIPLITLAGALHVALLFKQPASIQWQYMGLGFMLSAISGYFCIHYFLKCLTRVGVLPFVIYRICLGLALLYVFS